MLCSFNLMEDGHKMRIGDDGNGRMSEDGNGGL